MSHLLEQQQAEPRRLRRLFIAVANVLLMGSVGASTWHAYHAEIRAAARDAAQRHEAVPSANLTAFLRFPGTEGVYIVAGMLLVTGLAFAAIGIAARRRPDWLSLPLKREFLALPSEERVRLATTIQDYLLVVSTLCVCLVTFVTWHALGAATTAWPVPFGGDSRVGATVALMVVLAFLSASTLLFYREYRERLTRARRATNTKPAQDPPGDDKQP